MELLHTGTMVSLVFALHGRAVGGLDAPVSVVGFAQYATTVPESGLKGT